MYKTTINDLPIFKNSTFRNPTKAEEGLGLWIDRVGKGRQNKIEDKLRLLGLYGAVQVMGKGGYFINTKVGKVTVEDGDILLLFPEEPALYYPKNKWQVKWFLWSGAEADLLYKLGYLSPSNPIIKSTPSMNEYHPALIRLNEKDDMGSILERKSLVLSFIKDAYRAHHISNSNKKHIQSIEKIIKYINDSVAPNFTTEHLAKKCNLSSTHFRRTFKAYTGTSPKEYIISCKIKKAKKLILEETPIKEIADTLGFHDVFHFMRTFKKVAGINPGKFH